MTIRVGQYLLVAQNTAHGTAAGFQGQFLQLTQDSSHAPAHVLLRQPDYQLAHRLGQSRPANLSGLPAAAFLSLPPAIGLDADDLQGILDPMLDLSPYLHQPLPLDRIEDAPIARQPGLEHLHLELEESDVRVAPRRPRLLQQHQQRRQPFGEHRSALVHTERKSCSGNGPTFWTTPSGMQAPALAAMSRLHNRQCITDSRQAGL
jgi:hypothetical protein